MEGVAMKRFERTTAKIFATLFGLIVTLLGGEGLLGKMPDAFAGPNPITTCRTITSNSTLAANIVAAQSPCIVFGADNIALFMDGHTIDMTAVGLGAVAIETVGHTNVRVEGPGTVLTEETFPCSPAVDPPPVVPPGSITVSGGSNVRVRDVSVQNVGPMGTPLNVATRCGTGIVLNATPGALLLDNLVDSYARGIWVVNSSNISGGGASLIGHNTLTNNSSGVDAPSFGLALDGTSDWVVVHNIATANGGPTHIEAGITMTTILGASGSNENQIVGNTTDMNVGSGIEVSFGSTGNKIVNNHATGNNQTLADLADDNAPAFVSPGVNTWMFNNVCGSERGDIPPGVCPVTIP
jgi:hypothetical protein